jgi:hypothetical protein
MNVDDFFAHHGITQNPFGAEEARHDPVFERLSHRHNHPQFEKILGSIERPHTSVVFGEKGAGKTAIRLLIGKCVAKHNREHAKARTMLVAYDDLNPVLDVIARSRGKKGRPAIPEKLLRGFRLEDHQDAILALAVTKLVDGLIGARTAPEAMIMPDGLASRIHDMPRELRVDAAVLAALYDQSRSGGSADRWRVLRRRLKLGMRLPFSPLKAFATLLTIVAGGGLLGLLAARMFPGQIDRLPEWVFPVAGVVAALAALFWGAWLWRRIKLWRLCRRIKRETPALERTAIDLGRRISALRPRDLVDQTWPLPGGDGTNTRYELTAKLMRVLEALDYDGLVVLVDRVDEPTLIAGRPERMQRLVWPMLDSKFLQQERLGLKLLLPLELRYLVLREGEDFFQGARLDKQNLVDRLEWSGATLYDLCTDRLRVCHSEQESSIGLTDLFEPDVTRELIVETLGQMHQPRDAFKLLYSVIQEHCQMVPSEEAKYQIPRLTLEAVRKDETLRVQELYRGLSPA